MMVLISDVRWLEPIFASKIITYTPRKSFCVLETLLVLPQTNVGNRIISDGDV